MVYAELNSTLLRPVQMKIKLIVSISKAGIPSSGVRHVLSLSCCSQVKEGDASSRTSSDSHSRWS